ncbi:hypothetical protein [Catelliglobosispora koreensis]|uniref:hypothetical protein n=1 Tax=Catelliglobosispora koreensis TaxID=129052 RepID=UPI0012F76E4E|nr:hypothetical protein [Catelliglobosispora koreensis]
MSRPFLSLLAIVLLAGCTRAETIGNAGSTTGNTSLPSETLGVHCSGSGPGLSPNPEVPYQPLPVDFAAVSATRCLQTFLGVPGEGEWLTIEEQTAAGGLTQLADALRKPDINQGAAACDLAWRAPIVITLIDASGKTVIPRVPVNECQTPSPEVVTAIKQLQWTTVKQTKLRQVRSQLEIGSGCGGSWKPMVALEGTNPDPKSHAPSVPTPRPAVLRVCRYSLNSADTIAGYNNTGSYAVGKLASAGELTGTKLDAFLDAYAKAGPAKPCSSPQVPFAIVSPSGPWIAVELGGCHRATGDNGGLFQLDAATVALISG